MSFGEYEIVKWLHIIAMAYWLGGEWGVFNASREVVNPRLSLDERKRHMETAYRIDILPRTGIVLLLPLGLHMGFLAGFHEYGGPWLAGMWIFVAGWLALTWTSFANRGTDLALKLNRSDEIFRHALIPALFVLGIWSLVGEGPFNSGWYAAKVAIFGGLLIIGLLLRYIMRDWVILFRRLAADGSTPDVERELDRSLAFGRRIAYLYWAGIMTNAFLGVAKPF